MKHVAMIAKQRVQQIDHVRVQLLDTIYNPIKPRTQVEVELRPQPKVLHLYFLNRIRGASLGEALNAVAELWLFEVENPTAQPAAEGVLLVETGEEHIDCQIECRTDSEFSRSRMVLPSCDRASTCRGHQHDCHWDCRAVVAAAAAVAAAVVAVAD